MAHTLKIDGGSLSSALNLADTATTGYRLRADPPGYQPVEPVPEVIYGGSPYFDSNRPLFSRRGNVVEAITVDIIGSSVDDALGKLRALKRIIRESQEYASGIGYRKPVWLEFKPQGSTSTVYSAICNGYVQEPGTLMDTPLNAYMIEGVVITIEREPFWRELAPNASSTIATWAASVSTATAYHWGETTISSTPGDLPALTRVEFPGFGKVIFGIRSALAASARHNLGGLYEAESMTPGIDASATTDATASPGSGNSKIQVTFGTTTDTSRLFETLDPIGTFRVFARMKVTSTRVATVHARYGGILTPTECGITATVSSTAWRMYDLGVAQFPASPPTLREPTWAWQAIDIYAASVSGSGNLDIDFVYLMPNDEYYLSLASDTTSISYRYENCTPFTPGGGAGLDTSGYESYSAVLTFAGDLQLPPGDATLYWLAGDANWANTQGSTAGNIALYRVGRYAGARGT